jgi:hypothetical protein
MNERAQPAADARNDALSRARGDDDGGDGDGDADDEAL